MIEYQIALVGAVVGLIVGLTGMGGGALLTPILVLLFDINALTAVSSDLVAAVVMKPVGGAVHMRRGTVNMQMVKWLVAGSVPTAFASVVVLTQFTSGEMLNEVVRRMIGGALLLASIALVAKGAFASRHVEVEATAIEVHRARTFAIGLFGGAIVGLTSVGSGSLMMVLLLMLYPRLTAKQLVGTDLVQAVPLVVSGAIGHLLFGDVQLSLTGSLLLGAIPGVWIGAHISSRAPDRLIRPILPIILVPSALKMLGVETLAVGIVAGFMVALTALLAISQSRQPPPA